MVLSFYDAELEKKYTAYTNNLLQGTDQVMNAVMLLSFAVCFAKILTLASAWQLAVFAAIGSTPILPIAAHTLSPKWYLTHREGVMCLLRLGFTCVGFLVWDQVVYRLDDTLATWGSFATQILLTGGQWLQQFLMSLHWRVRLTVHIPLQLLCTTLLICAYPANIQVLHQLPSAWHRLESVHSAVSYAANQFPLPDRAVRLLGAATAPSNFVLTYYLVMMLAFGLVLPLRLLWATEFQQRQQFLQQQDVQAPIECAAAQHLPVYVLLGAQTVFLWWQVDRA